MRFHTHTHTPAHTHLMNVDEKSYGHDDTTVLAMMKHLYCGLKLSCRLAVPVAITFVNWNMAQFRNSNKKCLELPPTYFGVVKRIRADLYCSLFCRAVLRRAHCQQTVESKFRVIHLDVGVGAHK